jgi:hypothetical protein
VVKESPHMKLIITYFKSLDTLILGLQISKTRRLHCFEHYIAWAIYSCHHFQDFGLSSLSVCWLPQSKTSIQKSVLYIHVTLEYLIKFGYLIYIFYFLKSSQLSWYTGPTKQHILQLNFTLQLRLCNCFYFSKWTRRFCLILSWGHEFNTDKFTSPPSPHDQNKYLADNDLN